jgi:hypothetical protein
MDLYQANQSPIIGESYNRFGDYKNNVIEFSVYDENNQPLHWEIQDSMGKTSVFYREYFNLSNKKISYSYERYYGNIQNEVLDNYTQNIIYPISQDLSRNGFTDGSFYINYQPVTNVVGDSVNKIVIEEISPSGTELRVVCNNESIKPDFIGFAKNQQRIKYSIQAILKLIQTTSIYPYFSTSNASELSNTKTDYAFSNDIEVFFFINDILYGYSAGKNRSNGLVADSTLYGLYYIIENYLYENYEIFQSIDAIRDKCIEFSRQLIESELSKKSSSRNYSLFNKIFNDYFYYIFTNVASTDTFVNFEPIKTVINLGNGVMIPIMNMVESNISNITSLLLKIEQKDFRLEVGTNFYISKITFNGIYQKSFVYSGTQLTTKKLKGANFSNIEIKSYSEDDITLDQNDTKNYSGTDYRYFENFVKYSSISSRIDVYKSKFTEISTLESELEALQDTLSEEYIRTASDIEYIKNSFDDYEKFLYNNPNWLEIHDGYTDGIKNSTSYDTQNLESLVNTSPSLLVESEENSDYVTFMNMIGHVFDNIHVMISSFPLNSKIEHSEDISMSNEILYQLLESSGRLVSDSAIVKNKNYYRLLWNRFILEHPHILKKKGTRGSIESTIACYGIPNGVISTREYSVNVTSDNRLYNNRGIVFIPEIKNQNEYIKIPSVESAKTVQLKFASSNTPDNGTVLRIIQSDDKWSFGIIKRKSVLGSPFFTIRDSGSIINTIILDDIPVFDGELHNITIRRKNSEISSSLVPNEIEISVDRISYGEVTHKVSGSIFISGSFLDSFDSGSRDMYIGNYSASVGDMFTGTLTDVKLWNRCLENSEVLAQNRSIGNYSSIDISNISQSLMFALNFNSAINLYSTSSIVLVENVCPYTHSISHCSFNNFRSGSLRNYVDPVTNVSGSTYYPYQFKRVDVTEQMNVPNIATEYTNSDKIQFIDSDANKVLSPDISYEIDTQDTTIKKLGVLLVDNSTSIDTLKLVSEKDFSEFFGDPKNSFRNSYSELESFKRAHTNLLPKLKNTNIYINHVKNYVDPSVFDDVKNLVPAKCNLISGLMIENGPLEKCKYNEKRITIDENRSFEKAIRVSPFTQANKENNLVTVIYGTTGGYYVERSISPFRYQTTDSNILETYGEFNSFSDIGGYYFKDGVDNYVDSFKVKVEKLYPDNTISRKTLIKKSIIKFPDVTEFDFNGTLNGTFSGSYLDIGGGMFSIEGAFYGGFYSGSSIISNKFTNPITITGSYSGIAPVSGTLVTDFSTFSGKFILNSDFYRWAEQNVTGLILNDFRKSEKSHKYKKIQKNTPFIGKSNLVRIINNKTIGRTYTTNQQTSMTTVDQESGIPNGSLPFISTVVDRGRATVSSQGNGNVLSG